MASRFHTLLLCLAASGAHAEAGNAVLDAFVAPLREERFAELDERLLTLAREKTRDEDGELLLEQVVPRLAASLLSDETLTPLLERWAEARPGSRFEPLVRADVELRLAWRARSGGYADTVEDSAWPEWNAHLARADAALERAAARAPELALVPAKRLQLALLQGRPKADVRAQFDAALRIDPTCELAHRNLLEALTPRWGGSNQAMLEFARLTARKHPADARLGLLVHFAHLDIQGGLAEREHQLYYREPAVWSEVSATLRRMIEAYPRSRWAHNSLALMAMRAGKRDVALHEFRWIDRRWSSAVWNGDLSRFEQARSWALQSARPAPASPP